MPTRAVAYLTPGDTENRQQRAITDFCHLHDLLVTSRTTNVHAAAQLIHDGLADVVVAETDPRNGLRTAVDAAGGRLEVVHQRANVPTLADWLRRAAGRGITPRQIAAAVGVTTGAVVNVMRMLGITPPRGKKD